MSASEIIEQIKALPREERQQVVEFVHAVERSEPSPRHADDDAFDAVVDRVFEKHAELFKKLAE